MRNSNYCNSDMHRITLLSKTLSKTLFFSSYAIECNKLDFISKGVFKQSVNIY